MHHPGLSKPHNMSERQTYHCHLPFAIFFIFYIYIYIYKENVKTFASEKNIISSANRRWEINELLADSFPTQKLDM